MVTKSVKDKKTNLRPRDHMRNLILMALFATISTQTHAGRMKEIFTTVHEEIEFYYQATGDWNLVKVSDLEFISNDYDQYILVTANTVIRNIHTGKGKEEICLISIEREALEFTSINCF